MHRIYSIIITKEGRLVLASRRALIYAGEEPVEVVDPNEDPPIAGTVRSTCLTVSSFRICVLGRWVLAGSAIRFVKAADMFLKIPSACQVSAYPNTGKLCGLNYATM